MAYRFLGYAAIKLIIVTSLGCAHIPDRTESEHKEREELKADKAKASPALDKPNEPISTVSDDSIYSRIVAGYGFSVSHVDRPEVQRHIKRLSRHPEYFEKVTLRAQPYLHHIVEELDNAGMPLEIALLPIVESAFDPFAYSHGQAAGLWQFVPRTGAAYGLEQNWWYDGRRDIVASTKAATTYLGQLHRRFNHDWTLALAAYNNGQGNVNRAMRRNKNQGKATDFWHLTLPKETRDYVPKLIALAELIRHPEKYNLTLSPIENKPAIGVVAIESQLDLTQAADLAGITVDTLYKLNPGYSQWATAPTGTQHIVLPVERIDTFNQALAKLPKDQRVSWHRYVVKSGDTLSEIASSHSSTIRTLKDINDLSSNRLRIGQPLMIPTAMSQGSSYTLSHNNRMSKKRNRSSTRSYQILPGDSWWSIARANNTSVAKLTSLNGKAPKDTLRVGQSIYIPSHSPQRAKQLKKVKYKVRNGDSIYKIASRFGVSTKQIIKWNNIDPKRYLKPGQALSIFVTVTGS